MTVDYVLDILHQMMLLAGLLVLPLLGLGMAIGLLVAVFQAATHLQEATLNFLPKLLVVGGVLFFAGGWYLDQLLIFTTTVLTEVARIAPGNF